MNNKILTFGEIMMRLQPEGNLRFSQANSLEVCYGGGEANVAVSLASFKEHVSFFTKLPDNDLGKACLKNLNFYGIDTANILFGGDRLGLYFCEKGVYARKSQVIYDRVNSSVNSIEDGEINLSTLLDGVKWFHFTGITPALSSTTLNVLKLILNEVKRKNITVSCDLNYRKKLWSPAVAGRVMSPLMAYVDVLISNEEDCKMMFGMGAEGTHVEGGKIDPKGYEDLGNRLFSKFTNIKTVAFTLRGSISATVNTWQGMLMDKPKGKTVLSKNYTLDPIVDRIGGGDSFVAGLIYALKNGKDLNYAIDFATSASALKHTISGDFNLVTVAEVEDLMNGDTSGRVNR